MPSLSISMDKHKENCPDPLNVKRLCIRDYDDKGRQQFKPYARICLSCDVIIKEEKFEHTLTISQKKKARIKKKFGFILGLPPLSKEELEVVKKRKLARKHKRRKDQLER